MSDETRGGAALELALPADAEIEAALGAATSLPPSGMFGGAQVFAFPHADGSWFVGGYHGDQMRVFRVAHGQASEVPLDVRYGGRGQVDIHPGTGELLVITPSEDGRRVVVQTVPGYVAPPWLGGTGSVVPAAPAPIPVFDREAREYAAAQKRRIDALAGRLAKAEAMLAALQGATTAGTAGGVSRDEAWDLAGDRIYAELQQTGSPLMSTIWGKARDAAWALLRERGLIK